METTCRRMQDFDGGSFDLALCVFTVLLYLLDEEALDSSMRRAADALRPGGRLLIDIPSLAVFRSYSASDDPQFERTVRVIPETEAVFRYEEEIRILESGEWHSYADSFRVRHWHESRVFESLERAGLSIDEELTPSIAGFGSRYFLASRVGS